MTEVHASEKPVFVCATCNQSYSRAEYLRRHERKHTATRPFLCEDCPKTFGRSDVLLRHRRRCHPEEAALTEPTRPPPASGPKKASRPKNRNAQRPYPPRSKRSPSVASPEIDLNDPFGDDGPGTGLLENISFVRSTPGEQTDCYDEVHHYQPIPPVPVGPPEWSPGDSNPDESSNPSSSNPPSYADAASYLVQPSPDTLSVSALSIRPSFHPVAPQHHMLPEVHIMNNPPISIPNVEAGTSMWPHNPSLADPVYKTPMTVNQFGSWYAFPPIPVDNSETSGDNCGPTPDEVAELQQRGAYDELRKRGIDLLHPEWSMMGSEYRAIRPRIGDPLPDTTDRFYIPPGLFASCYTVPHWLLPPLQRLSVFAANTFRHILGHLGIIHEPTFRLADIHAWVAFALCTAGANRPYRTRNAAVEDEPWDAVQSIVRTEKTGMFVRLFAHPEKVRAKNALAGIHALLIYNSHSFLSDDPSERAVGQLFLNTIAKISRRVGLFDPHADFVTNDYNPYDDMELEWQRWVRREGCRRTTWLIYFLETVAAFENMRAPFVGACDVRHLPIPAAHSTWKATTSRAWASLMPPPLTMPFTLDSVMDKLFDFSITAADGSPAPPCFLDVYELGPFARLVMIVTLTRGIIEFGEGKQMGGYLVSRWILGERGPGDGQLQYDGASPTFCLQIIDILHKALGRWKIGWDYDEACELERSQRESRDHRSQPETKYFIHDAMPFWWMSHLLLSHLSTVVDNQPNTHSEFYVGITPITDVRDSHEQGGPNRFDGIDLGNMYHAARGIAASAGP